MANPLFVVDVRQGALRDAAKLLAKQQEQAQREVVQCDGGRTALRKALDRVETLHTVLEANRDSALAKLTPEGQIIAAKFAKNWVTQACELLAKMIAAEEGAKLRAIGKADAFTTSLVALESLHAHEQKRAEAIKQAIANGDVENEDGTLIHTGTNNRPPGVRPGPGIAAQRRAEAEADGKDAVEVERGP